MVVAILAAAFLGLLLTNIVVLLVRQLAKAGPKRREKSQEKLARKNGDALVQQSGIVVADPDADPEELKAETAELPPLAGEESGQAAEAAEEQPAPAGEDAAPQEAAPDAEAAQEDAPAADGQEDGAQTPEE